jgi:protein disulfide-isomerase A4
MTEKMDKIANEFRVDWLDVNHVSDEATQNAINCKPGDFFMVHNEMFRSKFEEDRIKIESADDVKNNKKPLVGQSYKNNDLAVYGDEDKPMVRIFGHFDFTPKYRKASQIIRKKVLNVAKKYKNDFYFVLMDEDEHKDYMKACHLDDTAEDVNICITQGKKKIYPLLEPEDDFSEDLLLDFVKKFKDGKIKPYLKSAKAPKNNNGPVKIVVSNEFDKIVMEKGKEVLIEFYAPWCGHCKQLEPIYKKLGKFYEKEDSLIIAKMDLTANDIPNEAFPEVTGFPTIFYVDKENNIEKYESGRDLASFKAFIDGKGAGEELRDEL